MVPTFDEVMTLTSTISCHEILESEECRALYDTLCQLDDGATVVEVGCDYGRSSSLIAQIAKVKQFTTIHVDPWLNHPERASEWMKVMTERCEYCPFILFRMTTVEAVRSLQWLTRGGIELAFIDGSHDQDVVERDLEIVATRVKPGGFLVAHDYPSAGVSEAIGPFVENGWEKVTQARGLGVWRRKGQE